MGQGCPADLGQGLLGGKQKNTRRLRTASRSKLSSMSWGRQAIRPSKDVMSSSPEPVGVSGHTEKGNQVADELTSNSRSDVMAHCRHQGPQQCRRSRGGVSERDQRAGPGMPGSEDGGRERWGSNSLNP